MAFAITPVSGFPPEEAAEFPQFIQWQWDGADLGLPNVQIINFVGDGIEVTRGTGENSNVITVRKTANPNITVQPGAGALALAGSAPSIPSGAAEIGWGDPMRAVDGAAVYATANTGTGSWGPNPDQFNDSASGIYLPRAGVVAYTGQTVVWNLSWAPTGSDPSPTYTDLGSGQIQVEFVQQLLFRINAGLLTITATVNGQPSNAIEMAIGDSNYSDMAWGPAP